MSFYHASVSGLSTKAKISIIQASTTAATQSVLGAFGSNAVFSSITVTKSSLFQGNNVQIKTGTLFVEILDVNYPLGFFTSRALHQVL